VVFAIAIALALRSTCAIAQSGEFLIGSTVTLKGYYPDLATLSLSHPANPATVMDPGVEFDPYTLPVGGSVPWRVDIDNSRVVLMHLSDANLSGPAAFGGFVFEFSGLPKNIASVSLDPASTLSPFAAWSENNSVFVNYQGLGIIRLSTTILNVIGVPEPSSTALFSICVIGIVTQIQQTGRRAKGNLLNLRARRPR
jgi:hypothetical protein